MTKQPKEQKEEENNTKRPKREFNIVISGQFRTLVVVFLYCSVFVILSHEST